MDVLGGILVGAGLAALKLARIRRNRVADAGKRSAVVLQLFKIHHGSDENEERHGDEDHRDHTDEQDDVPQQGHHLAP